MNLPGEIVAIIKLIPERDLDKMFQDLVVEKALQIEGREGSGNLLSLQAEIKQLRETQNWFKDQRKR